MADPAPLSVNGSAQDDIDYFVSWIIDHCCESTETLSHGDLRGLSYERSETEVDLGNPPTRRRQSVSDGLEQIVKCLGCHRNDTELWVRRK